MSQKTWEKTLKNDPPYCWFNWMMIETKINECRIYRDDWKLVKEGDIIIFKEINGRRAIKMIVTELLRDTSFESLFDKLGMSMVPVEGMTREKVKEIYAGIYNNAQDIIDIEHNGVISVKVKLLEIIV